MPGGRMGAVGSKPGASTSFNPLSYGTPYHAFWADDPDWTPPADGAEVTSWRNAGSNGTAATSGAGKYPLFDEVTTTLNNRASVVFDGSNDFLRIVAASASISQPFTTTVALYLPDASNDEYWVDGDGTRCIAALRTSRLESFAGGAFYTTSPAFNPSTPDVVVAHWVFNGSSSKIRFGGTTRTTTSNPGTAAMTGIIIGSGDRYSSTVASASSFGFVAVHSGDILGESWFSDYESGLNTYYGA